MKMIKLKKLLKESITWNNRKFGERLPTMDDYREAYGKKQVNEAISLKDAGGEIFDTIIAFKKIYEKSPHKKNRKINMYIKQLLKIEQQISDVVGDLD
tara:strand:- start:538 stop:831 length:294 start_codon:yes stop_codon:yes gene_type:complete